MNLRKLTLAAFLLFTLFVALLTEAWAQATEPSLGDVARQSKPTAKAKKTITDEDIPSTSKPPLPPATANADNSVQPQAQKAGASTASDGASPDATHGTQGTAVTNGTSDTTSGNSQPDRAASLKKDLQSSQGIVEQMKEKLANETDESRRQIWTRVMQHAQQQAEQDQKELDRLGAGSSSGSTSSSAPQ